MGHTPALVPWTLFFSLGQGFSVCRWSKNSDSKGSNKDLKFQIKVLKLFVKPSLTNTIGIFGVG